MLSKELRKKFIEFYEKKGHKLMPSSSLVPENDPSVLFNSAGMQQFKGYYLKPELAPAPRVVTIQPCFRTSDIDEVGDESHLTLFEMVGNFSFGYNYNSENNGSLQRGGDSGAYFKKETIEWAWEFLTNPEWLGLDKTKFVGTYFEGTDALPADEDSKKILETLDGLEKIEAQNQDENFWGPTGLEGPCGPTVEFHYDGLEVWNLVFNEYYFSENNYKEIENKGVDTGAGLERLLVVVNSMSNVYETDIFEPLIGTVREYGIDDPRSQRVIADHVKAAVFAIADGVLPSNKDAGYVVRRLVRGAMVAIGDQSRELIGALVEKIVSIYADSYPHLKEADFSSINSEIDKWEPIKKNGIKQLDKWSAESKNISGKMAFDLYQSHGFPIELTSELAKERSINVDEKGFWQELERHKEVSRAGLEKKFKGGLAGHSEIETRYHTATHLLLQALRDVLGEKVFQRGANINTERLRFDFSHSEALTDEQKAQVEAIVNEKISEQLPVMCEEMTQAEAEAKGAVGTFREKYGES